MSESDIYQLGWNDACQAMRADMESRKVYIKQFADRSFVRQCLNRDGLAYYQGASAVVAHYLEARFNR